MITRSPCTVSSGKAIVRLLLGLFSRNGPGSSEAFHARGTAKATLGIKEGLPKFCKWAVADYARAISLQPDNVDALLDRAAMSVRLKQYGSALADFEAAAQFRPSDPWTYFDLAVGKAYNGRTEEAIADLDQAINLKPDFVLAYLNRAGLRSTNGVDLEVIADVDTALRYSELEGDREFARVLRRFLKSLRKKL